MQIEFVKESHDHFDERHGPFGFEKIGLSIEGRVVWVSGYAYSLSSDNLAWKEHQRLEEVLKEIVRRCKEGDGNDA